MYLLLATTFILYLSMLLYIIKYKDDRFTYFFVRVLILLIFLKMSYILFNIHRGKSLCKIMSDMLNCR